MKIEKKETVDEPDLNILKEKREYLVLYTTTSWRRKEAKEKEEKFCPKESFVCVIVTLLVFGFTDGVFLADGPDKNLKKSRIHWWGGPPYTGGLEKRSSTE